MGHQLVFLSKPDELPDRSIFSGSSFSRIRLVANAFPTVPTNAVQLTIDDRSRTRDSPFRFPDLPIYHRLVRFADRPIDFYHQRSGFDSRPTPAGLSPTFSTREAFYGFNYAVSNITSRADQLRFADRHHHDQRHRELFSGVEQSGQVHRHAESSSTGPGPYYRYETGTSMSAADVSGVLALMQDYFTNTLHATPSPALLKAMLINGARPTGAYDLQVAQHASITRAGAWSTCRIRCRRALTNQLGAPCSSFLHGPKPDQRAGHRRQPDLSWSPSTNDQRALPLRVTLAWTDPPGDPAAAIKLVNNLDLVVTNLDNPTNPIVYYGNDIAAGQHLQHAARHQHAAEFVIPSTTSQNVYLPQPLGTNYSVTVMGYRVNVNAVTAQTNNVVQDYALVISCGERRGDQRDDGDADPPASFPIRPATSKSLTCHRDERPTRRC